MAPWPQYAPFEKCNNYLVGVGKTILAYHPRASLNKLKIALR